MRPWSSLIAAGRRALLAPMQLSSSGRTHPSDAFGPRTLALYLHFPFCASLCTYCVFNKKMPRRGELESYVAALEREIAFYGAWPQLRGSPVSAMFLGGGTPSVLPPDLIERSLAAVRRSFTLAPDAQITIEANPESASAEKLARYRRAGVNRVSVGVQSFDASILETLGRPRSKQDILAALGRVVEAGFSELSIDLMFGIPGQTEAQLDADLDELIASPATHASIFAMIYRPEAPLWRRRKEASLFGLYDRAASRLTRAGFTHYAAEDFTRSGVGCRYQEEIWKPAAKGFLGFGAGAMSIYGASAWHNVGPVDAYVAASRKDAPPVAGGGKSDTRRQMIEHLMAATRGLRIDPGVFERRFGVSLREVVGPLPRILELAGLLRREPDGSWATTRRGAYYSSVLWGELVLNQCAQASRAIQAEPTERREPSIKAT